MRYLNVPTYSYPQAGGVTVSVHEMRDLPTYDTAFTMKLFGGEDFDEVASRPEVYGDGAEMNAYKLHEANIVAVFEAMLDYSTIRSVVISP